MSIENYFRVKSSQVHQLKYFPFSNFNDFVSAVTNKTVKIYMLPMDYTLQWVRGSKESSGIYRIIFTLSSAYTLWIAFYLIAAFFSHNYWLIPYAFVPVIIAFLFNPVSEQFFRLIHLGFINLLLVGVFILYWVLTKQFPNGIYWIPLVIQYILQKESYLGSASVVRKQLIKNERLLCDFWKWHEMSLLFINGDFFTQHYHTHDSKTKHYDDIYLDWEEYVKRKSINQNTASTPIIPTTNENTNINTFQQENVYLPEPINCSLWNKNNLSLSDLHFKMVKVIEEKKSSKEHVIFAIKKCSECGHLYYYILNKLPDKDGKLFKDEFYVPISSEEDISKFKSMRISTIFPHLYHVWDKKDGHFVGWKTGK